MYLVLSLFAGRPLFYFGLPDRPDRRGARKTGRAGGEGGEEGGTRPRTCPICGTLLLKGERVKSIVFAGGVKAGRVTEKMSHLFGCPHCFPPNRATPRLCPVCGKIVPDDGYLIARMFENADRPKKHVHVLGCAACREGKKK